MSPALYAPAGHDRARSEHHSRTGDEAATFWALAAREGDRQAADRFIRALHLDVWRFVAHLSADPQSADDLTQDTFLRALSSLHGFEGRSSARTWLLTIARRTVIDSRRSASARPRQADGEDWQLTVERTQERDLPGFEEGVALTELLSLLRRERREAFVLTQLLGMPYAEAAVLCRCPVGTVRSRVARARIALWQLLDSAEDRTGDLEARGASA
ncbi:MULTISPECIES: sigma-70 family RNA polymerase sigma factor [unclassified Streptomyces]|uniref:sigma-70 family RNA polymerase sigma factor n=1 Tax=unclassified Streptomyces TaxID=2593676 RepID=UPI002E2DEAD3|nr:sigma-70 family RNA polymerase sigma factor [Streptomyces sp. NBC_01429]